MPWPWWHWAHTQARVHVWVSSLCTHMCPMSPLPALGVRPCPGMGLEGRIVLLWFP